MQVFRTHGGKKGGATRRVLKRVCDIDHTLNYVRDKTFSPTFGLFRTRHHFIIIITYTEPLNMPKLKHI